LNDRSNGGIFVDVVRGGIGVGNSPDIEFIEVVDGDCKVLVGKGAVARGCSDSDGT
jgi:hypothetical protein